MNASQSVVGFSLVVALVVALVATPVVQADESDAKRLLKAMSDYMAAQQAVSFDYDATLEVVTSEGQKIGLASSGSLDLARPDKLRSVRSGGFADVEVSFDGKTFTLLGKNMNSYAQIDLPGTVDHLIDELSTTYNRPLPAADLLLENSYDALMVGVVDIKDLGSGVIGGVECDHLAFRAEGVDWQIWIGQGERPYPYRYVITSTEIAGSPQYAIQTRNWKTGSEVEVTDFSFSNPTKATKVALEDLAEAGDLPGHFTLGGSK